MKGSEYVTCPECGREIAAYIPKDGDGSALRLRGHNGTVKGSPFAQNERGVQGGSVACKGGFRVYSPSELEEKP